MKNKEIDICDFTIDEIVEFIKSNIKIYSYASDKYFKELQNYWNNNADKFDGENLPYNLLVTLTKGVLIELLRVEFLYDFREL